MLESVFESETVSLALEWNTLQAFLFSGSKANIALTLSFFISFGNSSNLL